MKILSLLMLVFLSLSACAPAHEIKHNKIILPTTDPARMSTLNAAIQRTITFYTQWEQPVPPTIIEVTDEKHFACGTDPDPIYVGCWCFPENPELIHVWAGDRDEVPALYHELHHRTRFIIGHADESWIRINERGYLLTHDY